MSDDNIKRRLLALATEQQHSNFKRIKALLPAIEEAMEKGATRKAIVAVLNAEGIEITAEVFSTYLARLKKGPGSKPDPAASKD